MLLAKACRKSASVALLLLPPTAPRSFWKLCCSAPSEESDEPDEPEAVELPLDDASFSIRLCMSDWKLWRCWPELPAMLLSFVAA